MSCMHYCTTTPNNIDACPVFTCDCVCIKYFVVLNEESAVCVTSECLTNTSTSSNSNKPQ